ncbi:uncharacterized protein [Epargyreus clarus]|uniref:uncharacterized protein n=1 Tax=Epargyreus clarus TaxID=520877 RepID=UPI003C2DE6B8
MNSPQDFTCVFCNEAFEDKESLQEHFRKHGDPKFNNIAKNKSRSQNEQSGGSEKSEDGEMVGCDVCDEVFPSISKAITHKHKVHPDHDTKHFCPWCGKLFTMKHLYNKHIQSNHSDTPATDDVHYHCDCCAVDFFVVSAMIYHNKFFHRQDTELPAIGHSKKVKTYNQETIQIYYCPFCGEEYNNKVNLHKHMGDDHSDENQSPEEVLRCPLCEAVFYHLDAYELHLSFHTSEDVYSDENEISMEISDFSLETVPPIMEKVEEETKNSENEGIDKFLQLIMDESRESGNTDTSDRPKSKKHKKHKKSKKAAITLDEFLNMNKDVFGDGLDVQGIEEVPTQQVLKKCKGKKDNVKPIPASAIAKLKKQGITVKSNSGLKSPILKTNRNITVNTAKIVPNRIPQIVQEKSKPVATSNELLTKLLNQGNSQIKIIKKSTGEKSITDVFSQSEHQEPNSSNNVKPSDIEESKHEEMAEDTDNIQSEDNPNDKEMINNDNTTNKTDMEYNADCEQTVSKESSDNKVLDNISRSENSEQVKSQNNLPDTIQQCSENKADVDMSDKDDSFENTEDAEAQASDDEDISHSTQGISSNAHYPLENVKKTQSPSKSLDALKHLSGLITVKSTSNVEDKCNKTETEQLTAEDDDEEMGVDMASNVAKMIPKNIQNMIVKKPLSPQTKPDTPPKPIDSFKNLNRQLTIKPCISPNSTSKCDEESEGEGEDESDNYDSHGNMPVQNTNNDRDNGYFKTPMSVAKQSNIPGKPNHPLDMKRPVQVRNSPKEFSKEEDSKKAFNMDILKRLTNVTAKPVVKPTNNPQVTTTSIPTANSPRPFASKLEKNKQIDQDIEIFNIDDSDSDQELSNEEPSPKQSTNVSKSYETTTTKTAAPVNVLKNLSKNITVKPSSSPNKNVLNIKKEVHGESSRINSDRNIRSPGGNDGKVNTQTKQMNMTLNHTLKKLGNNISIKSQYSSMESQKYQMQQDEDVDDHFDMNDEESDSETSNKVKITEVQEEDEDLPSDTDMEYNENVIVQSPHASNSENEEETHNSHSDEEVNDDIERQIKTTTLPTMSTASKCLDNFKRNNRELTIKSLSDKSSEFPQVSSPGNKKEEVTRITKNVPKDTSNKQFREAERNEDNEAVSKNVNQSAASSSQKVTNQVNTVKTVKTFQSETIIEEITTTVTKTIRTVNQSSKQVAQNANVATIGPPRPRLKAPIQQGKPLQGITVRNAQTVGTKIRNASPRPTIPLPARPTGQLVPVRPQNQIVPRQGTFRANAPGPSNIRKMSPQLNIQKPVIGKPLKISPLAMNQSVKRPSEDASGHFSCFKKPKDSIIPQMDTFDDDFGDDSAVNYSSASSSRSDFSTTATKIIKGKSVVTAMQARSEQHSEQHITKLNNMSGLKVVRTSAKQASQVETRNDMSAANRTAMDAIERLQKQGLLIKKPRVETTEENEPYHSESDDDDYEEK